MTRVWISPEGWEIAAPDVHSAALKLILLRANEADTLPEEKELKLQVPQ